MEQRTLKGTDMPPQQKVGVFASSAIKITPSYRAKGQANSKRFVIPEKHTLWTERMLEIIQLNPPIPHTHLKKTQLYRDVI